MPRRRYGRLPVRMWEHFEAIHQERKGAVYLSMCSNAFGRNAANKNGCPSHQCVGMLFPDLPRMTRGKLGCQFVRTLLEGNPKTRASLPVSVWKCFCQICQEGDMVDYLSVCGNNLR
jgi:hypothetical protein